jgi:LPXTG-site transpeptidase (sortase) family protein
MSPAADRGGPFGRNGTESRNWMRAGAPGIAFRFRPAESSPVGPRAAPEPHRRLRPRVAAVWIVVLLATLGLAVSSGKLRGDGVDAAHAKPAAVAVTAPAAASVTGAHARLDPSSIARLLVPDRQIDVALSRQASRHERSAGPGQPHNVVVTASRDSSLRFLRRVEVGDAVIVESRLGERFRYRVRDVRIADRDDLAAAAAPTEPTLTLITSYPFQSSESAATLRYVVVATAERGIV